MPRSAPIAKRPGQDAHYAVKGSACRRGYGRQWRKARQRWLSEHPLCVVCQRVSKVTTATVVDHITPHRGNRDLFWTTTNWQSVCATCHNRKTGEGG